MEVEQLNQLIEGQYDRILDLKEDQAHNNFVRDHLERVSCMVTLLADKMELSDELKAYVRFAGLLHDFGGLFISTEAREIYKGLENENRVKEIKNKWKNKEIMSKRAYLLFKKELATLNYSPEIHDMLLDLFFQVEHTIDEIEKQKINAPNEVKDLIRYSARNMYERIDDEIDFKHYQILQKDFKLLAAIIVAIDVFDNGNSIVKQRMKGEDSPRPFDESIKFITESSYLARRLTVYDEKHKSFITSKITDKVLNALKRLICEQNPEFKRMIDNARKIEELSNDVRNYIDIESEDAKFKQAECEQV